MFVRKIQRKTISRVSVVVLLVLIAFGGGYVGSTYMHDRAVTNKQNHYSLLSRRATAASPSDTLINFHSLQDSYQQYLQDNNLNGKVSLYFEYLPTGSSIGINEDTESIGASLIKLPLAITVYKLSEQGKLNLNQKVALKKEWLNSEYGTLYKEGAGYQLTYRQAVQYMLRDSDNTAALMLFDAVTKVQGAKTVNLFSFVDVDYSTTPEDQVLIGPRAYSSVLKCLYYSCYVDNDSSQQILEYLSQSSADTRLTRYTPNNLTVAHKIGTFMKQTQSDCGIFYVPKRNYTLCIMVQGNDPQASSIIADLSLKTYEYIAPGN